MGETFAGIASSGPLLLAIAVAALAGLASFLSPCVLPLVPGYLAYMTGLAGADLNDALSRPTAATRGRIILGATGFIAGFTAIFAVTSIVIVNVGRSLLRHQGTVELVAGIVMIILGVAFLGLIPMLQREWRIHRLPAAGLASAPVLGAVFALSWTPCISPTLAAVMALAVTDGSTSRALSLAIAYCLGLGLPFIVFGLGFRKLIGLHRAVRRNSVWVTRAGAAMLILVGLALATGVWGDAMNWLRATVGPGEISI
ncbi:MAG TPA: cytochrome c biogenesis protein CcdA [Micromonosporaceae bacterium]|nr:cytochrome c biogenesis protein CcdA [Micromonosporaceae bacterium]